MPSSSLSVYVSIEGALGSHTYIPHTLITLISYLFLLILATIMLKMNFQYLATKRMRCGYEKLTSSSQKMMRDGRSCWVKSLNGRLRGLRLSRSRKLSLGVVVLSSRIVRLYNEVVNQMMNMENKYPAIALTTQWGLPVLSYSSHVCRRRVFPLDRKVTFCQQLGLCFGS
ncbi:hypothetical protein JHK87_054313 [Glycine soja]|nr:hypothetical protein JHK87_054313 [Glycine soja]